MGQRTQERRCLLTSDSHVFYWLYLHVKMLLIYVKRTKYVPFYLRKFLLPLLIFSYTFILSEKCAHQHREPEKNSENLSNQHGNWNFFYLNPPPHTYFTFLIGHHLCTIPCKRLALILLYFSEDNFLRNRFVHVWPRHSCLILASHRHGFKFLWETFNDLCFGPSVSSVVCHPGQCAAKF